MSKLNESKESKESNDFTLVSHILGGLPIVNNVWERLGLPALLDDLRH